MLFLRMIWLSFFLICSASPLWGAMPAGKKVVEGRKAEEARKAEDSKKAAPSAGSVRRFTEFVKRIEAGVLHTEGNQYNLTGVKVMDLTGDGKIANPGKTPKKTAEMTFVNNQLREVVIRQRH